MKALVVSGLTFLYSKEEKTCVLTETGSSVKFSSGYSFYLRDDKDKYQRSCFYKMLRKEEQYYREAKRKCQQLGGYVLEINSKEENDFVKELFKGVSVWLGAVQIRENNNTFRWERGGEMTFTDWASDYPIIASSLYNYCAILTLGGWKNMYCSFNPFYVVCEFDRCNY
uniref:Mannose-binding protein A-like n=1 Tax=Crassostrea virginica TaxID=6565 RepID=A0A8B8BL70_CRAVI|nr:mannose-binding protein A-like [Crassostrea virginica]